MSYQMSYQPVSNFALNPQQDPMAELSTSTPYHELLSSKTSGLSRDYSELYKATQVTLDKDVEEKCKDLLSKIAFTPEFGASLLRTPPPLFPPIESTGGFAGAFRNYALLDCLIEIIPEDSIYRKLLACIPFFGIMITVQNERSLNEKITNQDSPSGVINLINIKNHYKFASIVRASLTVPLVSKVALAVFGGAVGTSLVLATSLIGLACISYYSYAAYKNTQLIKDLKDGKHCLDVR